MLEHIAGQDRVYGDTNLYVKTESDAGLNRTYEWRNVYLSGATGDPRNLSGCRRVDCTQPSLSADGRAVVFIKTPLDR